MLCISLCCLVLFGQVWTARGYEVPSGSLAPVFPEAKTISKIEVRFSDESYEAWLRALPKKPSIEERVFEGYEFRKAAESGDGSTVGYAFFVDEIGKDRPITFLVSVALPGEVRALEVVHYRETRGGEIRAKSFLKQYRGRTLADSFGDVKVVRGATLSAYSATRAVVKALAVVRSLGSPGVEVKRGEATKLASSRFLRRSFFVGDAVLTMHVECGGRDAAACAVVLDEVAGEARRWFRRFEEWREGCFHPALVDLERRARSYRDASGGAFDLRWAKPAARQGIDFGSVYKGFILDRVAELMQDEGMGRFELAYGDSSFLVRGGGSRFLAWGRELEVRDGSLSVSAASGEYSRIVDARDGRPLTGRRVAYAMHPSAEVSDALSTACLLTGSRCPTVAERLRGVALAFAAPEDF
ncbi:MAG: FAD:protein FMN transferase [Nitrospirae bacterium]|nr:FAD:protein FMN transferase [Nitrospirota bacterium]